MDINGYEVQVIFGNKPNSTDIASVILDILITPKILSLKDIKKEPVAIGPVFIHLEPDIKSVYKVCVGFLTEFSSPSMKDLKKTILKEYPELWI